MKFNIQRRKINYLTLSFMKAAALCAPCVFLNPSFATLSAMSSNPIHGQAPVLKENALDNLSIKLYLVLDDDNSFALTPSNDVYYIGANTQFGQLAIKIDTDTTTLLSYFEDVNGDQISEANLTSVTYTWQKNGTEISTPSNSAVINTGACSSGATNDTYVLTVNGEIKAKTAYGLPDESESYLFTRNFTIDANNGICYLRPADMSINNGSTGINAISNQYDSSVFKPTSSSTNTGFDSSAHTGGYYYGSGFPTTAFKNAKFRIILSDNVYNASSYTFSILNNPSQISIQSNNQVIFNSKPENKTYYVKVTKSSNNFITFYPIKLESTNSWFTGYNKNNVYWTFTQWVAGSKTIETVTNPEDYCALKSQRLPRLRDLGNFTYSLTPYIPNSLVSPWGGDHSLTNNGFTRAMSSASKIELGNGGLLTEWGRVYYYDQNLFQSWWYWTSDSRTDSPNNTLVRFSYGLNQGNIAPTYSALYNSINYPVICVENL